MGMVTNQIIEYYKKLGESDDRLSGSQGLKDKKLSSVFYVCNGS